MNYKLLNLKHITVILVCFFCAAGAIAEESFPIDNVDPLKDPVLVTPSPASLSATLTTDEVTASATAGQDGNMVDLNVVNNGNRTLLIDGDRATVKAPPVPAASRDEVIPPPKRQQITSDVKEVAMSIGTIGVSGDIEDIIRRTHGPLYYGADQNRRKLAEIRFGARILFPGDSCSGRVFLTSPINAPVDLVLPVVNQPEGKDVGTLTVHVAPAQCPAPPPPAAKKKKLPQER